MEAKEEEEVNEVLDIALSDTSTDPGAVVIMHLNTNFAHPTMKSPGWPQNLAGMTIAQLLIFLLFRGIILLGFCIYDLLCFLDILKFHQ